MLKLKVLCKEYYQVKEGDTLESICRAFNVSAIALCKKNGISSEKDLLKGMLIFLPPSGNLYTVQSGDSIENLCGSKERYIALNGTSVFYPGMKVRI